jgi:prepilin-type N-terminal cleavage/methylation domain-containing protein
LRVAPIGQADQNAGFSLVEVTIVVLLISIISAFAVINIEGILPRVGANTALSQTVAQLRRGRELAIAQRRNVEIKFLGDNEIQLVRYDVPAGTTVLSTITLEDDMEFQVFDSIPDTPDLFGNSTALDFGGAGTLLFLSDGTLVDALGNPIHGSVFIGLPGSPETARAVTVLGATGRVRGYQWTGTSWTQ